MRFLGRKDFTMTNFNKEALPQLQHVANLTLGVGYVDAEALLHNPVIKTYLLWFENNMVGYGTYWVEKKRSLKRNLKGKKTSLLPAYVYEADKNNTLGIIGSVGVLENYRNHGGGTDIVQSSLASLKEIGATAVLVTVWESLDGKAMIASVLEKIGFENCDVLDDFWYEESILEKYQCPADGNPCHCRAHLFTIKL